MLKFIKKLSVVMVLMAIIGFFGGTPKIADAATTTIHLGIIGDSLSDEYRANDNRGGSYASTTLSWSELLQKYRGIDMGTWGSYAEPRRTGYAYNWARSDGTSSSAVGNQVSGLAQQVKNGQVNTVVVMIGINDLTLAGDQIYSGSLSGTALQQKINSIVSNITSIVDTIRSAGSVNVIVSNIPEYLTYIFPSQYSDPTKRARLVGAYTTANTAIASAVASRGSGAALFDNYSALVAWLASRDSSGNMHVGSELITWSNNGDEPHHAFLSDQHPGTVNQGLYANAFINVLNSAFSAGLTPFSDQELLTNAGIKSSADTTPPTVSITAPSAGSTVSATTTISANASDNVGVVGVQFKLDGANLGTEDISSPYSYSWNTASVSNGSHILTAVARDAAGNTTTSSSVTIAVNNTTTTKVGDLNNDNKVDIFDYNLLVGNFGKTGSGIVGDIDNNGKVDIFDYNLLVGNFGK